MDIFHHTTHTVCFVEELNTILEVTASVVIYSACFRIRGVAPPDRKRIDYLATQKGGLPHVFVRDFVRPGCRQVCEERGSPAIGQSITMFSGVTTEPSVW